MAYRHRELESEPEGGAVNIAQLESKKPVGLNANGETTDARARILLDALSVFAEYFVVPRAALRQINSHGDESANDYFPICNGVYLARLFGGDYRIYFRLDPSQPSGKRTGPFDHFASAKVL